MSSYLERQKWALRELENRSWAGESPATSVPMSTGFASDEKLCLTFLSHLPDHAVTKIVSLIDELRDCDLVQYYYPAGSLHLTIQNVRTISSPPAFDREDIEKAKAAFQESLEENGAFRFCLEGLLWLPASLSVVALAEGEFSRFVRSLRAKMEELGVPDNKQYVSDSVVFGNITISRFARQPNKAFVDLVQANRATSFGTIDIDRVSLVSTNSVCHPDHTTVLHTFELG